MRIGGLIHCADCNRDRFNAMRRRDQLTFAGEGEGWRDYTLRDAFELRMMLELIDNNGLDAEGARYICGNAVNFGLLVKHPLDHMRSEGDLWAGAVVFRAPADPADAHPNVWSAHFAGPLDAIGRAAIAPKDMPGGEPVRVVAVNASAVAEFVRARARDLGLPEGDDFTPIWE